MNTISEICYTEASVSELVGLAKNGDSMALAELIDQFRPMARSIGNAKASLLLPAEDGVSLCVETFVRTFPAYNPELCTLASYWSTKARQAVCDFYRSNGMFGRFGANIAKDYFAELREAEETRGEKFIDVQGFAKRHGVSVSLVNRIASVGGGSISLNLGIGDTQGTVADVIPGAAPTPAEVAETKSSMAFIKAQLDALKAAERDVVERYFGLNGRTAQSFKDIGAARGVTGTRAQQIFAKAISTIRERAAKMDQQKAA